MVSRAPRRPARTKNPHGQYFTPANIARLMTSMVSQAKGAAVLEPSAGEGVFVEEMQSAGFTSIQAVEIDPNLLTRATVPVAHQSFVTWEPDARVDVVIGNPPYIRWKNLAEDQKEEIRQSPYWGTLLNSLSDYLTVFILKSVEHLNAGGELVFITPAFWMQTQHAQPLRDYLLTNGAITHVVSFGESAVFPGVSSSIIIFRFVRGAPQRAVEHYRYVGERRLPSGDLTLADRKMFKRSKTPAFTRGSQWSLGDAKTLGRLKDLESWAVDPITGQPTRLGDRFDIANGLVSGLDRAFRLTADEYKALPAAEQSATLRVVKAASLQLLYSDEITHYINIPEGLDEDEARLKYPTLVGHLENFREDLEQRYSLKGSLAFWEWSFKRSEALHTDARKKVFVPCKERMTVRTHARFSLVPSGAVATQDVTAMVAKPGTRESAEYLAAYLSLDEVASWLLHKGLMKGGVAEFSERPVSVIPVRFINWDDPAERAAHDEVVALLGALESGLATRDDTQDAVRRVFVKLGLPTV